MHGGDTIYRGSLGYLVPPLHRNGKSLYNVRSCFHTGIIHENFHVFVFSCKFLT